jgi:molybdopterin-guanine dinucleotide biosynthesis protein A
MSEITAAPSTPAASALILAGGQSSRLGRDKALLTLDGEPMLAHIVHKLSTLSDDLIVVTNDAGRYGSLALPVRVVPDERPGEGSLMGIYSGLKLARCRHALAVACDMPFLNLGLLRYMLSLAPGHDAVVPRVGRFLEPLHAIYSRACLPHIARLLGQGQHQIIAFFRDVLVRYVEKDELDGFDPRRLSFVNVNTPGDWQRVQDLLRTQET